MKYNRTTTGAGIVYAVSGYEFDYRIRKQFGYDTWRLEHRRITNEVYGLRLLHFENWIEIGRFEYLKDAKKAYEMVIGGATL